jgi:serine/threonine-protein kinase
MKPTQSPTAVSSESARFGRYVLARKIGHGGMAEVFLGHLREESLEERPCVIKCILPELAHDPQFLAMFVNEAQLAAQMSHPNIVKVLDFGEHEGRLFMAMEYVDGLDCWRFARRLHPWGDDHAALAVWIVCRVLEALEYAHEMTDVNGRPLNVIHRDLSPSNIYLSSRGEVKLGDFGIARIDSNRYREISMIPKGKFGYVAPEQVEGLPIDRRADIFAVGVVLAELLIGKKMFSGQSQLSVLLDIKEARLDTLERNVDRVEPALLEVLYSALARSPTERFATASDFLEELERFLTREGRTPDAKILATQIKQAVDLSERRSSQPIGVQPATPITEQTTPVDVSAVRPPSLMPPTPTTAQVTPVASLFPEHDTSPFADGTPVTHESPLAEEDWKYTAKLADGRIVGPTPYAHIIELICSDEIGPETMVSVDGGKHFEPASRRPELTRHLPAYTPTWDESEIETPDRRGVLQLEAPSELILSLALNLETGMLICKQAERRKEIYFQEGRPVYISSNDPEELLGEYLVSQDALDRSELELALALLPKFNGHMGDTIIALGMLSAVELFNYIADQIKARFKDLVSWQYGHYDFFRGITCRPDVFEVSLEPFEIVSDHLISTSEKIPVESTLRTLAECTVSPSNMTRGILSRLSLPEEINDLLQDLLEPLAVNDLAAPRTAKEDRRTLSRALYIGVETGVWVLDGATPPWRALEKAESEDTAG